MQHSRLAWPDGLDLASAARLGSVQPPRTVVMKRNEGWVWMIWIGMTLAGSVSAFALIKWLL